MSDMSGLLLMSGADVTGEGSQISIGKAALRHKEKIKTKRQISASLATGGDPEAARLAGIDINLFTTGVYVVSGPLAGLAGVVLAMRPGSVHLTASVGSELDTIAAVVIGPELLSPRPICPAPSCPPE